MANFNFRALWKKHWVQHGLTVLLALLVYAGARLYQQRDLVIGEAPVLEGVTLDGDQFALRGSDRLTLVYFWGTWCPVCRLEQGAIESLSASHRVITVAMQSGTNAELERYRTEHGLKAKTLNDLSGEHAMNWGVRVTPAFFVVDRDGMIRYREVGYTTESGLRLRLWLAE